MKRRLLITVHVGANTDPNECGNCPFLSTPFENDEPFGYVCIVPGWTKKPIKTPTRHRECIEAEE